MNELHRLIAPGATAALADAQLLAEFVAKNDEKAFEVLVWRHSGLVLATCERILRDSHAAEDAFQATFLVFARKAGSIGRAESLAGWLHRTATRIALRSLAKSKRQSAAPLIDVPAGGSNDAAEWSDLRGVLDEEIGKLPEKYRVPIVLCHLEGQTNEAAAQQLGCPKGTVLSRLSRGRDWLKARLLRRGIALSAGALAFATPATASTPLVTSTVSAAIPFAGGAAAAGLVSPAVAALTEGALKAMFVSPLKSAAAALLLGSLAVGATAYAARSTEEPSADSPVAAAPAPVPANDTSHNSFFADEQPKREDRTVGPPAMPNDLQGRVVAVNKDGTAFSIDQPPKERGGALTKLEVKIGPKSSVVYQGVPMNGAKPTVGYFARIDLDETKTMAKAVHFSGPDPGARGGAGLFGIVRGVKDKSVTLQVRTPRDRDEGPTELEVLFDSKTVITFSNVEKDGARIEKDMVASVQLVDGTQNHTAGTISFTPSEQRVVRADRRPEVWGKLISAGDKSLTIEMGGGRGEEPVKTTVKISDKTRMRYYGVVAGAAKPTEGLLAQAWLVEGSKDEAASVMLSAEPPQRWTTINGRIVSAAADGSTVTVELPSAMRGEEAKQMIIKLPKEAKVYFSGIGPGEAMPKEGFRAILRLAEDSKDTAAEAHFFKPGVDGRR